MHNYIERIRNSSERKKRQFVAIASSVAMVIVVLLWVVYLNFTLPVLNPPVEVTQNFVQSDTNEATQTGSGNSFFGVITRGATVIAGNIARQFMSIKESAISEFSKIGGLATKQNEAVLKPSSAKFEPSTALEQIPPTKLPE